VAVGCAVKRTSRDHNRTFTAAPDNITLSNAVGGTDVLGTMQLDATGTTTLAAVTAGSLTTDAGGTTALGGNVTTTGAQTYNDAVRLDETVILTTTNNQVTFGSTVDSQGSEKNSLTINTGTATVSFGGAVGGTGALGTLTVSNTSASGVTLPAVRADALSITTAGAITAGVLNIANTATFAAGSSNDITLNNVANNFGTVAITSGNNVTLVDTNAIVLGASTVSGNLSVTAGGNITDS